MASFWFHLVLIMAFSASPLLSLSSSQHNSKATNLPLLTNPPPSSFQELSPEITPLLPSPGGVVPTPTSSSVSTIPSNPSPPNPDDLPAASGPAFSTFGPVQAVSTAATRSLLHSSCFAAFASLAAFLWLSASP